MGWQDLIAVADESVVSPWLGERVLRLGARAWEIETPLPREHGWYQFRPRGQTCALISQAAAEPDRLRHVVRGYLVGDRLVPDGSRAFRSMDALVNSSERVHLLEPGLDRFARVAAGRMSETGPLIFKEPDMPLGPEGEVLNAFVNRAESLSDIKGVSPALDVAFRIECWHRAEVARRRAELERIRREAEEREAREEQRVAIARRLGDGAGRREMAQIDFGAAAAAALVVGGAEYLDHVSAPRRGEMVVRFRLDRRNFECVCDEATLGIVDAGICLTDSRTRERGDTRFTLESLPSVIRQAEREGVLVVLRHVGDEGEDD